MFKLRKVIENLKRERDSLDRQVRYRRDQLKELDLELKIKQEDTEHLLRMKAERQDLELERAKDSIRDEYRETVDKLKEAHADEINDLYREILQRLPVVKVGLEGDANVS